MTIDQNLLIFHKTHNERADLYTCETDMKRADLNPIANVEIKNPFVEMVGVGWESFTGKVVLMVVVFDRW